MRAPVVSIACFMVALLSSPDARARPIVSSLDEVLAKSTHVVVATTLGGQKIKVTRALRGSLRGTVQTKVGTGQATVRKGVEVIAFLDESLAWSYVGYYKGPLGKNTVITLDGFYDFNAHYIFPGLLSLELLEARLAGKRPDYRFEGPIVALSDDGTKVIETSHRVTARVPLGKAPAKVTGLGKLPGLPAPSARVHGGVTLTWSTGYPRPFELEGEVQSYAKGVFRARFAVSEPTYLLRGSDLSAYLRKGDAAYVRYGLEVRLDSGEVLSGSIGDDYDGGPAFKTKSGRDLEWSSFESRDDRYFQFADRRWELDKARKGPALFRDGSTRHLLSELLMGAVGFRVAKGVGAGSRGTIRLTSTELLPAITAP